MSGDVTHRGSLEHPPPTGATVKRLFATALWCGKPGCPQSLYRTSETGAQVLNSEIAHIHARSEGGPRWDPAMRKDDNRHYDNLILLCRQHAKEIDETPDHFPPELLREWKSAQVAARQRAATAGPSLDDTDVAEVLERSLAAKALTDAVAAVSPFNPRMRTRAEALDLAARQSLARRSRRLRLIPQHKRDAVLIWMAEQNDPPVAVPAGQLRVLVARMGAGKTEQAIRWWDEGFRAAQLDPAIDIPIWLDARDVTDALDLSVTTLLGHDPVQPCRIVLDNLDGIAPQDASRLLDQARELVAVWPNCSVLATSRPGLSASEEETVAVAPWAVEQGAALVGVIAGDVSWHIQGNEFDELLTSPLTATAVARRLQAGKDIRVSRLALLADLSRTTLDDQRPKEATHALWENLSQLAARILNDPHPVAASSFSAEPTVWQMIDSGLVVNDDGKLSFALPVFEQHFGAQAVKDGFVELETIASANLFPRWRYALAFALSTSEPLAAEEYAVRVARTNPAALSWFLTQIDIEAEIIHGERHVEQSWSARAGINENDNLGLQKARWLRQGTQALLGGFGTCSTSLSRHRKGKLVQWGVHCSEDWISIGEAREKLPPQDVVAETQDKIHDITIASGWARWTHSHFPADQFGRWRWAVNRLQEPLLDMIRRRRLPVPDETILGRERTWVLAQRVMRIANQSQSSQISRTQLMKILDEMMERVSNSVRARWGDDLKGVDSDDVRWLYSQIERGIDDPIASPWPSPDIPASTGRYPQYGYSPKLSRDVHASILQAALDGYQDLVEHNFAKFGSALGLYGVLPVSIEAVLTVGTDRDPYSEIFYDITPRPDTREPSVQVQLYPETELPRVLSRLAKKPPTGAFQLGRPPRIAPFYSPMLRQSEPLTASAWPATKLAYEWLSGDLQNVGWIKDSVRFDD